MNDKFGLTMWNRLANTDIVHFVSPTKTFLILCMKLKIGKTLKLMAIAAVYRCLFNQICGHASRFGLIRLKIRCTKRRFQKWNSTILERILRVEIRAILIFDK